MAFPSQRHGVPSPAVLLLRFGVASATLSCAAGLSSRGATSTGRAWTRSAGFLRRSSNPFDDVPYCSFGPRDGFGGQVQVFVNSDNVRSLAFGSDGLGTQTEIQCRGPAPQQCLGARAANANESQQCDFLSCPCEPDTSSLQFVYMTKMMAEVEGSCQIGGLDGGPDVDYRVLLIGLGGGALPEYLRAHCSQKTHVESVEYDPRIVEVASAFFGLRVDGSKTMVENQDGLKAVQDRATRGTKYDVVLVDCFQSGGTVPEHCRDEAFVNGVHSILKPEGKLVQQVWAPQYDQLLKQYAGTFGESHVRGEDVELGANFLIIAQSSGAATP